MRIASRTTLLVILLIGCGEDEWPTDPTANGLPPNAGAEEPGAEDPTALPPPPEPEISRVVSAEDFLLRVHDYHWVTRGSSLYHVEGDGHFVHVFPVDRAEGDSNVTDFHEVTTTLPAERVRALRALLDEEEFTSLEEVYVNEQVEDGARTNFYLRLDGVMQRVYCQNRFPEATERVLSFLRSEATTLDRSTARVLAYEEVPRLEWSEAIAP